ncbi:PspC domain-containing protein [Parapedobacter deserti]|uniref:PspC domain-containing protein n=1 Tax=Parapedobacter deserti TaxID=1912957 RepID=A0ABV7JK11_9SPHI
MEKKLQRIPHEGAVAGVCAGLGEYFGIDKTWIRLAFVISVFFSGYMGIGLLGPIVYIVLWIVLPIKTFSMSSDPFDVDYRMQADQQASDSGYNYRSGWSSEGRAYARRRPSKDRYVAGIILLAVGIFFLLHQLGLFIWRDIARYWPVLIIFIGLATIFTAFRGTRKPTAPNEHGKKTEQQPDRSAGEDHGTENT